MELRFKDRTSLQIKSIVMKLPFVWVVCDTQGRFYLINASKIETNKDTDVQC